MTCSRRTLLKNAVKGAVAAALPVSAFKLLSPAQARAAVKESTVRWGFLVDTTKCVGCGMCVKACKIENEVPYDAPVTRTWVESHVECGRARSCSPAGVNPVPEGRPTTG